MLGKILEYAFSSKPAGEGSELTEADKNRMRFKKLSKELKPFKKYHKHSKTRKVKGDIT